MDGGTLVQGPSLHTSLSGFQLTLRRLGRGEFSL
jgi:hypothetical protein